MLYFASRGALDQVGGRTWDICHEEVRLCGEGPYTRRRAKVRYEPGVFDAVDELAEREVAFGSEPGDDAAVGSTRSEIGEHWSAVRGPGTSRRCRRRRSHRTVARPHRWEVEFGEVGDDPCRDGGSCLAVCWSCEVHGRNASTASVAPTSTSRFGRGSTPEACDAG